MKTGCISFIVYILKRILKLLTKNTSPDIYRIIQNNETTIKDVKEISKINDGYTNIKSFIPVISMGRLHGHSSTIRLFIEHNPTMIFGIATTHINEYDKHYKDLKNAYHINKNNIISNRKSFIFDYIIIDNFLYFRNECILDILYSMKGDRYNSAKIVGVGC